MQQDKFEKRLQLILDRRESPSEDPVLRAMAAENREYGDLLARQEALFDGLSTAEMPRLPDDFSQRVVQESLVRRRRFQAPAAVAGLLAVAASLLFLVAPPMMQYQKEQGGSMPLAEKPMPPMPIEEEQQEPLVVQASPPSITLEAGDYRNIVDQFSDWIPVDTDSVAQAAQPVANSLRPITDSVVTALSAMWNKLPPNRSPELDKPQAGTRLLPIQIS